MILDIILLNLALIALIAGAYSDIKTREVPDWLNFGLIFSAIGIRAIYSAITFNWNYILYGLIGLGIFVALGYIMFYAGQWGGGDSKLLMGLGAIFGASLSLNPLQLWPIFLVNALFIGAVYGLIFSTALAVIHRKQFVNEFRKIIHEKSTIKLRRTSLIIVIIFLIAILVFVKDNGIKFPLIALILLAYFSFYLFIFVKALEKSAMLKLIEPSQLTEGDWIAKDYFIDGKKICGPKDLGISKEQIEKLVKLQKRGKMDKILVKQGIPFVPSFLIAFIVSWIFGAWFLMFL